MKIPRSIHATLFVASICTTMIWVVLLASFVIVSAIYGVVMSGNSALVFLLCGGFSAFVCLIETQNYASGYLFAPEDI